MNAPLAEWQHGFAIDELKALAAPFREAHKPHVYGAFGLVKERDVAAAHAAGELLFTRGEDGAVIGAAIVRTLRSGSSQSDFAGRPIKIAAGSISVSALAATTPMAADKLLGALVKLNRPLWVEIFEEDGIARGAVERAGLSYRATKVMAGSEIKGLYSTAASEPEDDPAEDATLLEVRPDFLNADDLAEIRGELGQAVFAQHYSGYNKGHTWTAAALRGYDPADPTFIIKPHEMSRKWQAENPARLDAKVADTTLAALFPATMAIVARLPGAKDRVRFMKLAPGKGELTRHADITDREAGLRDGMVARMHIPIVTNPLVAFQAWDKRGRHLTTNFREGALCYLDQRKPHAVVNGGPTERVHLVVDTRAGPELRVMVGAAAEGRQW